MMILLKLDGSKKVIAQWNTDHAVEPGLFDATGRTDGPEYVGRTYIPGSDSFTVPPIPPKTKAELLKTKDKSNWTTEDIAEALQQLLP